MAKDGVRKTVGVYDRPPPSRFSKATLVAVAVAAAAATTGALIYFF